MRRPEPVARAGRVGYVLKMYPRFSETFVVTELIQMQRLGIDLEVFSLRPPTDGRFHASLAELRAPVTYLRLLIAARRRAVGAAAAGRRTVRRSGSTAPRPAELRRTRRRPSPGAGPAGARCAGITHLHAHFARSLRTWPGWRPGSPESPTASRRTRRTSSTPTSTPRRCAGSSATRSDVITVSDFNLSFLRSHFGADALARPSHLQRLGSARLPVGATPPTGRP